MSVESGPLELPVTVPEGDASLALLLRIADAVEKVAQSTEDAGKKGEDAGRKQKSAWETLTGALEATADRAKVLSERYLHITGALDRIAERAEAVGQLAEEQERLDLISGRLGVSLDEAAASAGRFADEVEPMNAAGRLLQEGVRVSQDQLNALMRVAGAASVTLGVTTAQATEQLTDALVSVRERGLMMFGTELAAVAGSSHTLRERLAALVSQANHTEQATDTSADSVRRLRDQVDDYKRTVATAFMQETVRISAFGAAARTTNNDVTELNHTLTALGQTAATVLNAVARPVALLGGAIAYGANAVASTLGAAYRGLADGRRAAEAALDAGEDRERDIVGFMRQQVDVLTGIAHDGDGGTSTQGGTRTDPSRVLRAGASGPGATPSEEAVLRGRRANDAALDRRESTGSQAPSRGPRGRSSADDERRRRIEEENRSYEEAMREAHRSTEGLRQATGARAGGFMTRRLDAGDVPVGSEGMEGLDLTDYAAKERAQRATTDAAFASSDEGRGRAQQRDRAAARERRAQDDRLEALRSFTDQFEDAHGRQVNAARMMSEGVTQAFSAVGEAMGKHFQLWRQGKETIGDALRGILADTLSAIGKEAAVKGSMQIAEGLANLIIAPPLAAQNFAAAAAFFGVAGIAGAAGEAMAPSASTSAGGGAAGGRSRAATYAANDNTRGATGGSYTWNIYAPTFGGRDGSRAEVGQQIGRYTAADAERTRRAA